MNFGMYFVNGEFLNKRIVLEKVGINGRLVKFPFFVKDDNKDKNKIIGTKIVTQEILK